METNKTVIENLWTLVAMTNCPIVVVNFLGEIRAYLVDNFLSKTRDISFNEIQGGRDITDIALNLSFQAPQLNSITLEDKIQGYPKKSFKFGHDNYILMVSNKKNEY